MIITAFDPKNAVVEIRVPAGGSISVFKNNTIISDLATSMGILDSQNLGYAYYYYSIEPKDFGTFTIKITYDVLAVYSLTANINTNKYYFYSISDFTFAPNTLKLFDKGYFSNIIGGLTLLKGTSSSQSDILVVSDIGFEYQEFNNDYGGIVTNTAISFAGYDTLRINIAGISSWQSTTFKASVYLSTSKPSSVTASGITTYNYQEAINATGNSDVHIKNYSKEIVIPLAQYQGSYYIIITTASGQSVAITPAFICINVMQLEKSSN